MKAPVKAPAFGTLVAQAGPDQDNVGSGTKVTLDGSGSTPTGSGRVVTYSWARTGGTTGGTVTLTDANTLAPSFTADTLNPGDADVEHIITLTVTDNQGSSDATDTVTITVKAPAFGTLVAQAGPDQDNVGSGTKVTLDGSGSTPTGSGRVVTYSWARTGGTTGGTVTLTDANTLAPSFTADTLNPGDADVEHIITLTVTDNQGSSDATDTVTITVKAPAFGTLVAQAGPDQDNVGSGTKVTLDGSGSTPTGSGRVVTYSWARTGGTTGGTVTLTDANTLAPSFTADTLNPGDADVEHIITLTVTDNQGSSDATDTVTITVKAPAFGTLVAQAGPDQDNVGSGTKVTLDGSGSTPTGSGRVVTYSWARTGGTQGGTVTLTDANTLAPSFTADTLNPGDADVEHIITLTVTDNQGSSDATDTVTITVKAPAFGTLVAQAGPDQDNVGSGTKVTLDGSGSTPTGSGRVVTYSWARTGGTQGGTVTLTDANTLAPSFTADTLNPGDADVEHIITLTVTDNQGSSDATDTVTITVKAPAFGTLVAQAGPDQDNVGSGTKVTLDGSGSTPTGSGRVVTYSWARTGGTTGGTVTLTDANTLAPSFTADTLNPGDADVEHIITLTVTDNQGSSDATDTVTITVKAPAFGTLVAQAGPDQDNVGSGTKVTLDGSGSTPTGSGRVVTYSWARTGGTTGGTVTLTDANTLAPSFTADTLNPGDADVEHIITLTVTDNQGSSDATDTVTITVKAPAFGTLVAQAGPDQDNVGSGTKVTLDGSGSTPTGSGRVVTYSWARTGGTTGGTVTLTDANTLAPSFTADTLNPGDADVEHIITLTVTDNQGSSDATDTVTITVKAPAFGTLVAQAGPDQDNVGSGTKVTLDGSGSTPTGSGRVVTYSWARTGGTTGGTVTLTDANTLAPSFTADTLNPGDADVEHIITLTVTDNQGSSDATDTVTITVKAPAFGTLVAQAGPDQDNVGSGTKVTLDGSGSTPTGSGRVVTYSWARTGGTTGGTVTLTDANTLAPSFTADTLNPGDADVEHIITLTVTDNQGSSDATDTVTITVKAPAFGTLVAQAGPDQDNVGSGTKVTLDGSGSTPTGSGRVVTYSWARTGGTTGGTVTLTDANTLAPSFTADTLNPGDADVEHIITLTVTDNQGSSDATDTVTITVKAPAFGTLVAQAGPDQDNVGSGTKVTLDGSGSTPTGSGRVVTYSWARTGGTTGGTVTLTDANTLAPSFTADTLNPGDADVEHIITLTVTDNQGSSDATDTVTITVKAPAFGTLVAQAGPDQDNVGSGTKVTLDGSGSTPTGSGRVVTYSWARTGGTQGGTVTLTDANTLAPSFTADTLNPGDADVEHIITLTVTDNQGSSDATDTVTITVKAPAFGTLVAQAGPDQDNVGSGTKVTLDGSGSTPTGSGRVVTYSWARTGGTQGGTVTLTDANTLAPSFTADTLNPGDADVEHIITLTVTDNQGSSDATDTVTITVKAPAFGTLVAQAGPDQDNVGSGTKVTLDGSGSTPTGSGRVVTYSWARTGGTQGGTVTLTDANTLAPSFTADTLNPGDADVEHVITLTVTDDQGSSDATDTVTITVKAPAFGTLVAQAGPDQDNVGSGTKVTLDGSGSTPTGSGRVVTYSWARTGGTQGGTVTLTDANTLAPSFTADTLNPGDADVEHVITLTVTDNQGSSDATDTVTITVKAPAFGTLVAQAGPDQDNVGSGTKVTLDGSGSTPTGSGRVVTYSWARTGGTQGGTVTLTDANTLAPSFTADTLNPGDADVEHIITLTVTDNQGSSDATDTVTITVKAPAFGTLVAQAGPDQDNVGSGTKVTLDGSGSTPTGSGRVVTYSWARTGGTQGGTVTLTDANTLAPSFTADTLNPGDADVEHIITLTVTDNQGSSDATDTVTITVKAPAFGTLVAQAGPDQDNVGSGTKVTLDGSGSTPTGSGRVVTYSWARTGGTTGGTVTLTDANTLAPSFTADTLNPGDADVEHIITLTVTDNQGSSDATDTVTITVKAPAFGTLVAQAGPDQDNVGSGTKVTLDGSGSTPTGSGRVVTYSWARTGGTTGGTVTLTDANTLAPSFTADTLNPGDADVEHIITLTVTDNQGSSDATDTVTITVKAPAFGTLVAQAGPDQDNVGSGTKVTLDGSGSTPTGSGRVVTYSWARTGGTTGGTVTLTDANTLAPSFTADTLNPGDADVEHIITLTVTDNQGSSDATDTVTITVKAPAFGTLVAQAGPDQDNVGSGTKVTLDGSGSTPTGSGRVVTYSWARTGGTQGGTVTLTDANTLAPSFTADTLNPGDADVEHVITLTVTDDQGSSDATDTVTITVKAPAFGTLVAQAGPDQDNVGSGTKVTLDGSGSTPTGSGRVVTYSWARTGGTTGGTVTLTDANTLAPSFTADTLNPGDADVEHIITLTVTDNQGSSDATDTVTITVKAPAFGTLVAQAGPDQDNVGSGTKVTLDGSGSTPTGSGRVVTYSWARTGGTTGGTVTLTDANTLAPSFTADTLNPGDADVEHIITLTVTDNQGSSDATDTVTITVKAPAFGTLVAQAGPDQDNVGSGTKVTLDGSGSTPTGSGRVVTYSWARTGGTTGGTVTLTDANTLAPSFTADTLNPGDADVEHIITLTVTDNQGSSDATDTVTITVKAPAFGTLVAQAGPDQDNVGSGTKVTLDGSGSTPTGSGRVVTYSWARTGGTTGGTVTLTDANTLAPSFTADTLNPGDADVEHIITLTVTDNQGSSDATDTVTITVKAPAFGTLVAQAGPDQDNVGSGTKVTLDGSGSTPTGSGRVVTYSWARTGGTTGGTVTLTDANTLAPSFTADTLNPGDADVEHIITLTVTDNQGSSDATDTVTITVKAPAFGTLVAQAGPDQDNVGSGTKVTLDGSGSTPTGSGRVVTYSWARTGGTQGGTVTLTDANTLAPSFTADTLNPGDADVEHIITLTVTDNQGSSDATDTVTITVKAPAFGTLVAQAGPDQDNVGSGTKVTLDGSGSTPTGSGRVVTYSWARTGGTQGGTVTLTDANTLAPSFTADTLNPGDADVEHIITLTVTDNQGSSDATDTVTITVKAPAFGTLVAQAGPDQDNVGSGTKVTLDGSGSTPTGSGRVVTYSWARTGGTQGGTVTLTDANTLAPSFTADTLNPGDADVEHIITLTVTDNQGSSDATDTVTITVKAPAFGTLVAQAGPDQDNVGSGTKVTLDGSGSTPTGSGRVVTYSWARTGGTQGGTVTLTDANTLAPSFTADTLNPGDADVEHIITLTVTDNQGSSDATDTVTITVKAPAFGTLVAQAGPDQDGGTVTLTDANTLAPSFTADTLNPGDADVEHIITLTVTDNQGSSDATDTVTITVKAPAFGTLVAQAGPDQDNVGSGTKVTLDGSGSTPTGSGRVVTYSWARTGGTTGGTVTLTDANTLAPSFTADTLNPGDADVEHIITLTVTDNQGSSDATDTVTITVKAPAFGTLVAQAGPDQDNVGSGTKVTLDGSGSTPTGSGRVVTYSWARTGGTQGGTVTLTDANTLAPSFTADTLNPGDADVEHIITLTVTDNQGSSDATDTVTITVKAPAFGTLVAQAGPDQDNVGSGTKVTLDGSGSTPTGSGRVVTYSWARTGGTQGGTVTLTDANTLAPSFTADTLNPGDADVEHIITLTVTDNQGSSDATDTVTITVKAPAFGTLVAQAGPDQDNVGSGTKVTLDGSGSTPTGSGRVVTYSWARTGGTTGGTVTLTDANTLAPSFTADTLNPGDADVEHIITLTVTDNQGSSDATDTVTITVKAPAFGTLVAQAGPDQDNVGSGTKVTLDGSGSTPTGSGRVVTYSWARTGGTTGGTVTLTDANTLAPSFTADTLNPGDADVEHIITLTVTDNQGSSDATDTVTITVKAPAFGTLVAQAGPDQDNVGSGTKVTLDGSGSTPTGSGRVVTYSWARTGGTTGGTVTLTDANTLAPSFTADTLNPGDADVEHIITLTVTDNQGSSDATDTVTITVKAPAFGTLVAQAGPDQDNVGSGTKVTLDGSGSTPTGSGRVVTYSWARTGGTTGGTVTLTDANTLAPSFTADTLNPGDADVEHIITLTVTDNQGSSDATDTVTITVKAPAFGTLVAQAGPDQDNVGSGTKVTLDGSGSTPTGSGRVVTYSWARTGGTQGGTVTLTDANTLAPSFTADTLNPGDADVEHIITLTVTDDQGSSDATDTVTITVKAPAFGTLVAQAGPDQDNVGSGTKVTLDGSGSTPTGSGRVVTYSWARTGGTTGGTVTLTDANTLAPSFTADTLNPGDADVEHIITLTVTDNQGSSDATDTVEITVTSGFVDPVADAGDDKLVGSGATVMLDGSGSTHDSRTTVTYAWTRTGGNGGSVTLSSASAERPTFTADTLADGDPDVTHTFTLTVTDSEGGTDTDTMTVTVTASAVSVDILVSPSELMVQEGGTGTYQVKLSESPRREVHVIARSDNENIVLENAQLTFNANNWDAWQEIRISTVADSDNAVITALIQHSFVAGGVALGQSGVVSVTVREEDPVLDPIGDNLTARATALLNTFPNLSSFLNQDGTTPGGSSGFTFKATNGRLTLDGGFVRDSVWGEIAGSNTKSKSGDTRSVLGSFGIHRKYSERFLAGAMLQIDLADHDLDGLGSIDGTGWLAGPYFAARHGTWPLYFEGRLLYGQSDNDIRFNDSQLGERMRVGSFDTTRLLAQLRIKGEIALSDGDEGPRLIPYADTRWFEDRAAAFTDSIGTRISGQTVSIGQLELGSNVEVPIAMSHGAMTFTGGLGLVYSKTEGDYIPSVSRSRGRGEIGFSYGLDDNLRIDFESFYDGIGASGYEGYGLSLNAEIKF